MQRYTFALQEALYVQQNWIRKAPLPKGGQNVLSKETHETGAIYENKLWSEGFRKFLKCRGTPNSYSIHHWAPLSILTQDWHWTEPHNWKLSNVSETVNELKYGYVEKHIRRPGLAYSTATIKHQRTKLDAANWEGRISLSCTLWFMMHSSSVQLSMTTLIFANVIWGALLQHVVRLRSEQVETGPFGAQWTENKQQSYSRNLS